MFQLPFHVEQPWVVAAIVGVAALLFALLWLSFNTNFLLVRDFLSNYFRRRFRETDPTKAATAARVFLASMTMIFAAISVFGFSVASGVIRNGEKVKPARSEESQVLQQYLEDSQGRIDVKELIRQDKANREAGK